jgi:hypothetical protein
MPWALLSALLGAKGMRARAYNEGMRAHVCLVPVVLFVGCAASRAPAPRGEPARSLVAAADPAIPAGAPPEAPPPAAMWPQGCRDPVPMLHFAVTAPPPPTCVVRVAKGNVPRMSVSPDHGPSFDVKLTGLPMTVTPGTTPDAPAWVDVHGLFELAGKTQELLYRPKKALELASGMVRVGTHGRIVALRAAETGGLAKVAVGGEASAVDVPIACDLLTLADEVWPPPDYVAPQVAYAPITEEWRVFASPGSTTSVAMHGAPPLAVLGRAGAWMRVKVAVADDTRITGWVRADQVEERSGGVGYGESGCGRGCGIGLPTGQDGLYEGKARIGKGTALHDTPGGGTWAVLSRDAELEVRHARGEAWVRVLETPGISDDPDCDGNRHAFVPVGSVVFTPGVRIERK